MKKFFSISLSLFIMLSVLHISIATHYCGGAIAATKVSLSGKPASCGMEGTENTCPLNGKQVKSNCCDDNVLIIAVDNNYSPSFSEIKDITLKIFQVFDIPLNSFQSISSANFILTSVSPPDKSSFSAVSLAEICVFRN